MSSTSPSDNNIKRERPRNSRARYLEFVEDYKKDRLDSEEADQESNQEGNGEGGKPVEKAEKDPKARKAKRREYLRAYFRWLWPHRYGVAVVFVLALLRAGLEMIEPLFMRFIIDRSLLNTIADATTRMRNLQIAGIVFLSAIIVSASVQIIRDYRQRLLNVRVMLSLRRALFDRLLKLPLPKLWEMKTGGILSRLTGDIDTTTGLMQMAVISPSLSAIRIIVGISILFALNWRLALTAIAIIPGAMVASFVFAKRVRPVYRAIRKDVEQIDGRVGETFSGIRVVRAFRREARELLDYLVGRHGVLRKELFAHRRELVLWTSWGLLVSGVPVAIVWYGGYLHLTGRASIGDIMAFQWYTFLLLNPVWNIVNSFSELQRSLAAMERVFEVLAMPNDKPDRPGAIDAPAEVRELKFERVNFAYHEDKPVIRDFDVTVKGGSVVALVGRSGAGKTTVTDLVARFHDPTSGRLMLNGTDIRDFKLKSYRGLLALVQQEVFLFDGTVRDNIAYGRHDVSNEQIEDAARRANAHEFIAKLPKGYESIIGERGVKLSGGQRQRLAIARAILASPQILILDEATSNLDTESEQLIQAAMSDLLSGRTTFVIAHRLSTIRRADLILLMEEGRVLERGTHDELMGKRGAYHTMVLRQMHVSAENVEESWT
jgi:ATP-binding cassette, subfamily B, bacterial